MIQVLEHRGFVAQDSEGYSLTTRLFELGLERPPVHNLVEIAMPVMRQLSSKIGQSCHLALSSRSDIVAVARMESSEQIGFSVRVGYRKPLDLRACLESHA
jgi:DNA-binding IclR family transcriptional regulator